MATQTKLEKNKATDSTFKKNLLFFRDGAPEVYQELLNYKPQHLSLAFDEDNNVNVINLKTNRFVYPEAPSHYAAKQVDHFLAHEKASIVRFFNSFAADTAYIHSEVMDRLIELRGNGPAPIHLAQDEELMQHLFVIGIGAGFHLEELVSKANIKDIVIIDNNKDSFYISMHFIDWQTIFSSVKGQVKIIIGETEAEILQDLHDHTHETGIYALTKTFAFRHYANKTLDQLVSYFLKKVIAPSASVGFYDDERVGLAHTVENCERSIPPSSIALLQRKVECQFPSVVIGNGPSLDNCQDFLRSHKDKLILISCGTSLGSLEGMGIKPDIHVEQERPYNTYRWLSESTSDEFRSGIYFYALNTVYPDCFSLFDADKVGLCLKPNDLGSVYLSRSIKKGNTLAFADLSNPTVTNLGMSLCVLLGIRNVFLAGIDLGMKEITNHHSKHSYYSQLEDKVPNLLKNIEATDDKLRVKGRNGTELYTTPILNNTRLFIERLIDRYDLNAKNLGDGAKIHGAPFVDFDYPVSDLQGKSKTKTLAALHNMVFDKDVLIPQCKDRVQAQILKETRLLFALIKTGLDSNIQNETELVDVLAKIKTAVKTAKIGSYTSMLLKGTLESLLSAIYSVALYGGKENMSQTFVKCREVITSHLDKIEQDIKHNFYNLDTYTYL